MSSLFLPGDREPRHCPSELCVVGTAPACVLPPRDTSARTPPPGGGRVPASSAPSCGSECRGGRTYWEAWWPCRPPRVLLPLPTGHSCTSFLAAGSLAGPPGAWGRGARSPAEAQSSSGVGGPPEPEAPEAGRYPLGSHKSTGKTRTSPVCFVFSKNSQESGLIRTRPARGGPRAPACVRGSWARPSGGRAGGLPRPRTRGRVRARPPLRPWGGGRGSGRGRGDPHGI